FAGQPALETDQYLLAMRDQIIDYIQSHKLNKPVMMGHSLGGFLSLWIASVQPDLVGDLIIVDALPFFPAIQNPEATPESMKPVAANMRKMMASATTEQVKQSQQYFLSTIATSPENLALIGKWGVESHQPTVAQAMYEMQTIDLRDQIEPVKSRVLVMGAWIAYKQYGVTHDSTMKNFATQYQKISSVDIKLTDTAKHFIMFDEPKWFYQQIDSFLNLNKKSSE
ncbi:MAG: alpha/beta hydrolase, partial [Cyclobacteriaceae bacterium]